MLAEQFATELPSKLHVSFPLTKKDSPFPPTLLLAEKEHPGARALLIHFSWLGSFGEGGRGSCRNESEVGNCSWTLSNIFYSSFQTVDIIYSKRCFPVTLKHCMWYCFCVSWLQLKCVRLSHNCKMDLFTPLFLKQIPESPPHSSMEFRFRGKHIFAGSLWNV